MNKFKVGDKVRRCGNGGNGYLSLGDIGIVTGIRYGEYVDVICSDGHNSIGNYYSNLELVTPSKPTKQVPEDKHIVIIDSCQNFDGIFNSYNDAKVKAEQGSEEKTIYKMVEVAKVKSIRQTRKVSKSTKPKKRR